MGAAAHCNEAHRAAGKLRRREEDLQSMPSCSRRDVRFVLDDRVAQSPNRGGEESVARVQRTLELLQA